MKNKFVKVIVAVAAMTLVLGTTAFASPSPAAPGGSDSVTTPDNPSGPPADGADTAPNASTDLANGVQAPAGYTVVPTSQAIVAEAQAAATSICGAGSKVLYVFDLSGKPGQVKITAPAVKKGGNYAVLHKANGKWQEEKINEVGDGYITATFASFSPVAIVAKGSGATASPKTGNSVSMALMIAMAALAGAAVCFKKYGYSK